MAIRAGVKILTDWGMRLPSSLSIVAYRCVTGNECSTFIDTCGFSVPRVNEIARLHGGPVSDYGRSIPTECVAGSQAMQGPVENFHPVF